MLPPGISRKEIIAFGVISFIILAYVIARAILVPLVHDEAVTFLNYVLSGKYLPGEVHWDANNHVLNSALTINSVQLFGEGLFALRLPNVLSYTLWASAAWWLVTSLGNKLVRWCLLLALLMCPFLLDFFSLCRGYGIGMAMFLMALASACSFADRPARVTYVTLLISATAAIWADMALIPALGIMIVCASAIGLDRTTWRNFLHWSVSGTIVAAGVLWIFALLHVQELSERELLYHGSLDGFFEVTVKHLFYFVTGSMSMIHIGASMILIGIVLTLGLRSAMRHGGSNRTLLIGGTLLLLSIATMFAARGLHINYPRDRAALHFAVLAIVVVGVAVDQLAFRHPIWKWVALVLLLLPLRTVTWANVERTTYWPEQSLPDSLLDAAEQEAMTAGSPRIVGLYHQHGLVWQYAQRRRGWSLPAERIFSRPDTIPDLFLVDERFNTELDPRYEPITKTYHNGLTLFKRRPELPRTEVFRKELEDVRTTNEFIDLPLPDSLSVFHNGAIVELVATIRSDRAAACNWVLCADRGEQQLQYASQSLLLWRNSGDAYDVRMVHVLQPVRQGTDRVGNYIWNIEKASIEVTNATITVYRY